jgi:hypothetical protein
VVRRIRAIRVICGFPLSGARERERVGEGERRSGTDRNVGSLANRGSLAQRWQSCSADLANRGSLAGRWQSCSVGGMANRGSLAPVAVLLSLAAFASSLFYRGVRCDTRVESNPLRGWAQLKRLAANGEPNTPPCSSEGSVVADVFRCPRAGRWKKAVALTECSSLPVG